MKPFFLFVYLYGYNKNKGENKMKRFITLLLASVLLLSACGAQPSVSDSVEPETSPAQMQQPPVETEKIPDIQQEPEETTSADCSETQETDFVETEKNAEQKPEFDGQPETEPTQPNTSGPSAAEPKPSEPAPAEPKPSEPTPTEPKPSEPSTTEPKPTEPAPTEPKPVEPEQPKVDKNGLPVLPTETVNLHVGDSLDLLAGYSGTKTFTWKSNKKAAAIVSEDGVVTAVDAGVATITVSDGKNKNTCLIHVRSSMVDILYSEVCLQVGETFDLEYRYYAEGTLTWKSSDPSVATVSSSGHVIAKKRGDITISLTDGRDTSSCKFKIRETDHVLTISTQYPVFVGEKVQMDIVYEGSDLRPLQWSSADTSVLTVDQKGVVTGVSKGYAVVSCTDGDVSWDWRVEVRNQSEKAEKLYFHHRVRFYDGVTRFAGDSMRLLIGTSPNRDVSVTVTSSNPDVVKVTLDLDPQYKSPDFHNYKVQFKKAGKAVVTMTSADGCVVERYTVHVKGTYDCDPGKTKLTPGEFSYCATQVGGENGQKISMVLSGYRYYYVKDEDLTWQNAKKIGESLAKEWYGINIKTILITYAGWSEEHNMHLFYIGH